MCLTSRRQVLWGVTVADAKALEANSLACQPLRAPRLQPSPNSQGCCQRSLINEREPLSKCRTPTWCSQSPLRASGPAGLRVSEAGGQPAEHLGDSHEVPYSQSEPGVGVGAMSIAGVGVLSGIPFGELRGSRVWRALTWIGTAGWTLKVQIDECVFQLPGELESRVRKGNITHDPSRGGGGMRTWPGESEVPGATGWF